MMEAVTAPSTSPEMLAKLAMPNTSFDSVQASVAAAYRAGIPVLAGTDTNTVVEAPGNFTFGDSLHHELELLVDGDPLHDIRAVRSISRVWCGGIEHTPAHLAEQP
jgi:hypothetical protein